MLVYQRVRNSTNNHQENYSANMGDDLQHTWGFTKKTYYYYEAVSNLKARTIHQLDCRLPFLILNYRAVNELQIWQIAMRDYQCRWTC